MISVLWQACVRAFILRMCLDMVALFCHSSFWPVAMVFVRIPHTLAILTLNITFISTFTNTNAQQTVEFRVFFS